MKYWSCQILLGMSAIVLLAPYAEAQNARKLPTPMAIPANGAYQNSPVRRNSRLAQPTGVTASVKVNRGNDDTVLLRWNSVPQAARYRISQTQDGITLDVDEVDAGSQKGKTLSYEDRGPIGIPLEYAIIAVNAEGESLPSARVKITLPVHKPEPPFDVTVVGGNNSVLLRWHSLAPKHRVYRRVATKNAWELLTTTESESFTDKKAQNGVAYTYVVSGINAAGEGVTSYPVTATPVSTRQTPQTLLARTQTFLRTVGEPATTFSKQPMLIPGDDKHYARRWKVFCGQTELEIIDATGQIVYFSKRDDEPENAKMGKPLSQAQAEQRANALVLAAGIQGTYTSWKVESNPNDGRHNDDPHWGFAKQRLFQGVPIRDQRLAVFLTKDNKLDMLICCEQYPDPTGMPNAIPQASAVKAAEKMLLTRKITGAKFASAGLSVVQPNNAYTTNQRGIPSPTQAEGRVAWRVAFVRPHPIRATLAAQHAHTEMCIHDTYLEVWIDAKNGTPLGGEVMR
jgi:hypothetical protein